MQKLTAMFNLFVGIFQRRGCTISKFRNTHTNAPQRHNTLQTMANEAREGQAAGARQMAQGAATSSPNTTAVLCMCARGGKFAV